MERLEHKPAPAPRLRRDENDAFGCLIEALAGLLLFGGGCALLLLLLNTVLPKGW